MNLCPCPSGSITLSHLRGGFIGEVKQNSVAQTDSQGFAQPQDFPCEGLRHEGLQLCRNWLNNFVDPFWHGFTAKHAQGISYLLAEKETKRLATSAPPSACPKLGPAVPVDTNHLAPSPASLAAPPRLSTHPSRTLHSPGDLGTIGSTSSPTQLSPPPPPVPRRVPPPPHTHSMTRATAARRKAGSKCLSTGSHRSSAGLSRLTLHSSGAVPGPPAAAVPHSTTTSSSSSSPRSREPHAAARLMLPEAAAAAPAVPAAPRPQGPAQGEGPRHGGGGAQRPDRLRQKAPGCGLASPAPSFSAGNEWVKERLVPVSCFP